MSRSARFRRLSAALSRAVVEGIASTAVDPTIIIGLDGRIVSWNAAAERLYGYRADEMLGMPIGRLAPNGRQDDLAVALDMHLRGLPPSPFEAIRKTSGNQQIDVAISLSPLRNRAGRLGGIAAIHRDPTASKAAEDAIRQGEQHLFDFFEHAAVGIHWLGPDGTILWANRAELHLLGYQPEEYIGHSIGEFVVDPETTQELVRRLQADETVRNFEVRIYHKSGAIRHLLVSSNVRWENGEFVHTRCFSIDITERKQAEHLLRESERRFRTMADCAPVMLWVAGSDAKSTFFNQPWLNFTGRSLEETLREGFTDVHPDDVSDVVGAYLRAFHERALYRAEYRLHGCDGEFRWVLDAGTAVYGASGDFEGYIGSVVDISEMHEAARERERYAANQARIEGVLLTAREMSHLLNNDISGAIGSLELLAHNPTLERYHALIPGALAGLESAARYLRELQNIVRVETKQTPVGEALDLQRSTA